MTYGSRPWLSRYPADLPTDIEPDFTSALDLFGAAVAAAPDEAAIQYFDGVLTFAQVDAAAEALAATLADRGFAKGDRLALYVQNNPAFVIGLVAAWKAGGAAVAINPMNRAREVSYLLLDSGASALLTLDDLYQDVARHVLADQDTLVRTVVTTSALDWQTRNDPRLFSETSRSGAGSGDTLDLVSLIEQHARSGRGSLSAPVITGDDLAILTYTSGTTGVPKGAMNTHGNLCFNAQTYRDWMGLRSGDGVLGIAPLFHITGLVGHIMLSMLLPSPLVLTHRFHPEVMHESVREHRPVFTIGAITAFTALAGVEDATAEDYSSLRIVYSGGAAIAPSVVDRLEARLGFYIHNIYGLTETTSPTHAVPLGERAPVDPESGALSVGVPVFNTVVRILDDDGVEVPVGEVGEFATSGPQVIPAYWHKPEETAASLPDGELRTGDVGFMDEAGWYFLVDRKKDMINAAGYKVWPREVEDVLYQHPAVREAAVVGVPDEYRGETVKAFVSLQPGVDASPEELIAYCKTEMAAYKYPRSIELVEELPKTVTGKILRRELRTSPG